MCTEQLIYSSALSYLRGIADISAGRYTNLNITVSVLIPRGYSETSGLTLTPVFSSKTRCLNKTLLSLDENCMNGPMRARFYFKVRVSDEDTGVGVKLDEWPFQFL